MAVGDDFKVSRRYREEIVDLAAKWRAANPKWATANKVDVVALLTEHVLPDLERAGRKFELKIVEDDLESPHGWVDFQRRELCIQQFIWDRAGAQDEHARLVLAHEMGHMILHRDQISAFSRGLEKKLGFVEATESAEQQANWFATSLLLPDVVLMRLRNLDDLSISILTMVGLTVVRTRRREIEMDKRYRNYTGDQCSRCSSFTVMRVGISTMCEDCGAQLESS